MKSLKKAILAIICVLSMILFAADMMPNFLLFQLVAGAVFVITLRALAKGDALC